MDSSTFYISSVILLWVTFAVLMLRPAVALRKSIIDGDEYVRFRSFLRTIERFFILLSSFQSIVVVVLFPNDEEMHVTKAFVNILLAGFMLWATQLILNHIRLLEIDAALEHTQKTPT